MMPHMAFACAVCRNANSRALWRQHTKHTVNDPMRTHDVRAGLVPEAGPVRVFDVSLVRQSHDHNLHFGMIPNRPCNSCQFGRCLNVIDLRTKSVLRLLISSTIPIIGSMFGSIFLIESRIVLETTPTAMFTASIDTNHCLPILGQIPAQWRRRPSSQPFLLNRQRQRVSTFHSLHQIYAESMWCYWLVPICLPS